MKDRIALREFLIIGGFTILTSLIIRNVVMPEVFENNVIAGFLSTLVIYVIYRSGYHFLIKKKA